MTREAPVLEIRGVVRSFRLPRTSLREPRRYLQAVRGVDLEVTRGESLGLVGESGSGKSTLARLIMALDTPQEGQIRYGSLEVVGASERELVPLRREVQVIFQDPMGSLDPRLHVRDVIKEPLRALRVDEDHEARMLELLDAVGLQASAADRYPHEFSGGQRQRIAIARALAPRPSVLVADEPVSALDVSVRAQILNLLSDLKEQFDLSLILISHDLSVVYHVCDRVAVMYLGRIVETGRTDDIFGDPQHPYTRQVLGAIPRLDGSLPDVPPVPDSPPSPTDLPPGCAFASRCPLVHDRCHVEDPHLRGPAGGSARDNGADPQGHLAACHVAFEPDPMAAARGARQEGQR